MKGLMMNYQLTIPHILERANKLFYDSEVVTRKPDKSIVRYKYKDLYKRARALAKYLTNFGLSSGDRVATLMYNNYIHLEAYLGIPSAGFVLHTVNIRLHEDEIAYIINHAQDRILIIEDTLFPLLEKIEKKIKVEQIIVVPLKENNAPEEYIDYEAVVMKTDGKDFIYPDIQEDVAAGLCYTSGTTGKPKGVLYSHRAISLHALAISLPDVSNIKFSDTITPVVPMFHVNAWGFPFAMTMHGCKQVYPGPHLDAKSLLELYEKENVNLTVGVPTIWLTVVGELERKKYNLHKDFTFLVGGASAPQGLIKKILDLGYNVIHGWGMTETTPVGLTNTLRPEMKNLSNEEKSAHLIRQGTPLPFIEIKGMNENGEIPWDGKTMGELYIRGPWIASAYYGVEAPEKFMDGFFATGDIVIIDKKGYVKIVDRSKDLIKSGGEWISSVDLENALMSHNKVKEAAVIAYPHPVWQERPIAFIVIKEEEHLTEDELKEFLSQKFAKWWLPDYYIFIDEIPRTSAGKFLKRKLRDDLSKYLKDIGGL
jgi:fatty-acyl-CoA synthase